jgi:hypothetical protein
MLQACAVCAGLTKLDAYAVGTSAVESLGVVTQMRDLSLNLRTPAPGEPRGMPRDNWVVHIRICQF